MSEPAIEQGQFDDAPEDLTTVSDLRQTGHVLIDEDELLQWSEDDMQGNGDELDEDELDERDFDDARVEDEDWEMAERGTPTHHCIFLAHRPHSYKTLQSSIID